METSISENRPTNFIRAIVERDLADGSTGGRVATRFPPEPNGYLHVGHVKAIALDFGIARDYNGRCNLRMDDTNPTTESVEYVEAIQRDIRWLGFEWDNLLYASDYFQQFYDLAEKLILDGKAYVDSSTEDEIRELRGTVTEPGRPSIYRSRSVQANLELFREMKAGKYPDGAHVLRGKIDLASPNMKMRDPLLYRIRHAHHYRTGDDWCIYPMYDWAHPLSDAIEGITHSLCTLEFENNRELYDWVVQNAMPSPHPHQYEFARLALDYTVMSKRKFIQLVEGGHVSGWNDPRMPTISGMRRRGFTPEALRNFAEGVGVARANSKTELAALEHAVRDNLNPIAPRVMCVIDPVRVVITNYPETGESLDAPYFPHDIGKEGSRAVPFARELFIEREDFMESPPKRFHRLSPGQEVRLRYAYIIKCIGVKKDADGNVVELRCEYDPDSKSGGTSAGRRVKGTIHWVAAETARSCEVRLYDRLFSVPDPGEGDVDFIEEMNPGSLKVVTNALVEPSVENDAPDTRYQFERQGYFWRDPEDSGTTGRDRPLVFNRIVTLKDSWAKVAASSAGDATADKQREKAPSANPKPKSDKVPRTPIQPQAITEGARKLIDSWGLSETQAVSLTEDASLADLFVRVVPEVINPAVAANWIINELPPVLKSADVDASTIDANQFAELIDLVDEGTITNLTGKELLAEILTTNESPRRIVASRGLAVVSDTGELRRIVAEVVAENGEKVEAYRGGKKGLIGFFIGQVMHRTEGRADPAVLRGLVEEELDQ